MNGLAEKIQKAKTAVASIVPRRPVAALLLGTGQGGVTQKMKVESRMPYSEIPGFGVSTVESHANELVFGKYGGRDVLVFSGRFHLYEGFDPITVTMPVRLAKAMGAQLFCIQGIVGGLDRRMRESDLVIVEDHINLMGANPLVGRNDDSLGSRFPDMIEPYDLELVERMEKIAREEGFRAHRGVYAAVLGPNLETRAEYKMLRTLGADVVGMSTVPEAIAAVHAGIKLAAVVAVSDLCLPDALKPACIEAIIEVGRKTEPMIARIFERLISGL